MRLYDSNNQGPLERLLKSLTSQFGGRPVVPQSSPLGRSTINRILGTEEEFFSRYKSFEDEYFRLLGDSSNRSKYARVRDMNIEKSTGILDLSRLTYKNQEELKDFFKRNVLQMEHLLPEAGIPNLEFPSGNFYSSLLQYDVDDATHPASVLFNRMFFNVQPAKSGLNAINFGTSNMLSTNTLRRITSQGDFQPQLGKKILTLDVETTDVLYDGQVRQFAYQMEEAGGPKYNMKVNSFINERMNIARVSKSGMSYKMADFVNIGLGAEEMGEGGQNFIKRADELFTEMLNADHISGHNLMFDIGKMDTTLDSLGAYEANESILTKRNRIFERINTEDNYFIDTAETMRSYLRGKASSTYGMDPDRATNFVNQLLSPEFRATMKSAPVSMENISLNTNLLNLLEQEAVGGSSEAKGIMTKISQGSHVADVDVALQSAADRYRREGRLDFRFDPTTGQTINSPLTDFEKYARNKIFRSQATNPLTNIASVQHLSDASFNYITSQDSGIQNVKLIATRRELGLAGDLDSEGVLSYNNSSRSFTYRNFGATAADDVDEAVARTHIVRTLNEARARGDGAQTSIRIGSENLRVTRNIFDEKILDTGLVYLQDTAVHQGLMATRATAGVTAEAGDDLLIRSLGLTNEQFGRPKTYSGIMSRLKQGFAGSQVSNVANPLDSSDSIIEAYHTNAARAGLPFNSLNVQNRVFSVGLAEATHSVGMAARGTASYAANADLTTEFGISFFNMQKNRVMGSVDSSGDLLTPSRVMSPFSALFEVSENTAADRISDQILSVKAFGSTANPGADIMATDLNRFTMSFVSGSGETGSTMASRVNLVWGANQAFDEGQSKQLASFMMDNVNEFLDTVDSIKNVDADLGREIADLKHLKTSTSIASDRDRITTRLAEHIRERGIVVGYVEGEAAEGIREVALRQGADITGNDRFFANFMMRLGFADKESGIMAMSAISDVTADNIIGRTSEVAQRETAEAVRGLNRVSTILEDSSKRREARRIVMEARDASSLDRIVDLSRRAARDFSTPMTDFYLKNKKSIGFAGIGLAAASIGYYMYNKSKEQKVYSEAIEPMPPEPGSSQARRQTEPVPLAQSTRRDPLVTAGVVGNLDRNKIGHSKMGPNKYNHLYGG